MHQLTAPMVADGPMDGELFLAWVEQFLCPTLRPGDIAILDNLSSHKVEGVAEAIHATGARLLPLPPYSPDFNPIEQAWSKLKQLLRGIKARILEQLEPALAKAIDAITPKDAQAFFSNCGYRIQ